jgi:hypothetical protein
VNVAGGGLRELRPSQLLSETACRMLGEDVEAVELYPATGRLVDDANQFHLFA